MITLPEKKSDVATADSLNSLQDQSAARSCFWVIFTFLAIQALLAMMINFSRNTGLFYLQPVVSVIFCVMTLQVAWANTTSTHFRAVIAVLLILAYLLATAFFFITAIFIGGLPG